MSGLLPPGSQPTVMQPGLNSYAGSAEQSQKQVTPIYGPSMNSSPNFPLQHPKMNTINSGVENGASTFTPQQLPYADGPVRYSEPTFQHNSGAVSDPFPKCNYNTGSTAPVRKSPIPVQNGPYASPVPLQSNRNLIPELSNGMNGTHPEHLLATQQQWPSPIRTPSVSGSQTSVRQLPTTGFSTSQLASNRNLTHSPQVGNKQQTFNASTVPSTGLPPSLNSPNTLLSSPQITPGPSQPPSARSSRNPSPISTQRYDFMEGQFSNKPSPSNSGSFLGMGHTLNSSNPAQYSSNYSPAASNSSQQHVSPVIGGYPPMPASNLFPTMSPVMSQPIRGSHVNTPTAISPARPRYPSQVGYNQMSQPSSPAVSSHPGGGPPPPAAMYQQHQLPPHQEVPEGPVGGLSGYDPQLHAKMAGMSVNSSFSRLWGNESVNLLQDRNILPALPLEPPKPQVTERNNTNCCPTIFRSTLTKVPENNSLLQKSRLPFGILIHPFKDVSNLPIIQCNAIVRCRNCRTYINPFVSFVDQRRWLCNLCFRTNDVPEEFLYDPSTRSYGDPSRRPEIKSATVEFIAPSDYMLRPPQPAVYLFVLDVSHSACEIGYLEIFCKTLLEQLDTLPGDSRTKLGFITFDGSIHFYNLADGLNQPHMLIISDVDDVFLPSPDNLLVNLHEGRALICDLLEDLPKRFANNNDSNSCLGAALQVAYKLMAPVGGRVTVVQACLPNTGPGQLKNREDPNLRAAKDVSHVGPANDFYKKLALECSGQQVAMDLFLLTSQYVDIATVSCISKFSSGCIQYYPGFHRHLGILQVERFTSDLTRYLSRRIGFEAVMRIRCTRGLSIHTFHGNFFVRSTDLLSLPNVNPDIGFGMQIAIDENLTESTSVCFQAAVLYTSSSGERRIRVHTLSLPVVSLLNDVWGGADQEAIVGLVSKMAVDRSVTSSLSDARDALINVAVDLLGAFKTTLQSTQSGGALVAPYSSRLIPLFMLALLKHVAFRTGVSTKLDERIHAMERMKTLPLAYLMKYVYPTLYPVHALDDTNAIHQDDDAVIPQPVILQLSSEKVDRHGVYVLDTLDALYLYINTAVNDHYCQNVLGVPNFSAISEDLMSLPELHTPESERLRNFISWLQTQRPSYSPLRIIRGDSNARHIFLQYMLDDRSESLFSYYEFLQHLRQQISK